MVGCVRVTALATTSIVIQDVAITAAISGFHAIATTPRMAGSVAGRLIVEVATDNTLSVFLTPLFKDTLMACEQQWNAVIQAQTEVVASGDELMVASAALEEAQAALDVAQTEHVAALAAYGQSVDDLDAAYADYRECATSPPTPPAPARVAVTRRTTTRARKK